MRAAGIDYESRRASIRDVEPPRAPGAGEVEFRIREVGVCGTDRELAAFRRGWPPHGQSFLVLGHEAAGQVTATGAGVSGFRAGDWVVPMIRRACPTGCAMCGRRRRDLCLTGQYTERGIFGEHGYLTETAIDDAADLEPLPPALARAGALVEPLSVVEKVIDRALALHPGEPRTALVIGGGPIGLLAGMALTVRGLTVTLHSQETEEDVRARLAERAGLRYRRSASALDAADIVIEAAGAPEAGFLGIARLRPLGVCGILGSRDGAGVVPFLRMVLHNQTVFGSVNASPDSFRRAVQDLRLFDAQVLDSMIHRVGFEDFPGFLEAPPRHAVKIVHVLD
jgi:threonine dehydrogenase-like Zn-dependent dehydrogenase